MPLSSLSDPVAVARARLAMDRVFRDLEEQGVIDPARTEAQRQRIAAYVTGYAVMIDDVDELVRRVVARYLERE